MSVPEHLRLTIGPRTQKESWGDVYAASVADSKADYQVRIVDPGWYGKKGGKRFRMDQGILRRVTHIGVHSVLTLVEVEDSWVVVSDPAPGVSLRELIREGIATRALLEILGQVGPALTAAYETALPNGRPGRLLHRNICADTIRLEHHGMVIVTGFGLSRQRGVREAVRSGEVTQAMPVHLSPDILRGEEADLRGETFAMAATLYEAMAVQPLISDDEIRKLTDEGAVGERWADAVELAVNRLPGDLPSSVRKLLHDGLMMDAVKRPTPATFSERCAGIVSSLPGPSLISYCRDRTWVGNGDGTNGPWTERVLDVPADQFPKGRNLFGEEGTSKKGTSKKGVSPNAKTKSISKAKHGAQAPTMALSSSSVPKGESEHTRPAEPKSSSDIVNRNLIVSSLGVLAALVVLGFVALGILLFMGLNQSPEPPAVVEQGE